MSQKDWTLEEWIINYYHRFIGEMPPWIEKKLVEKYSSPLTLNDSGVVETLETLEKNNIIHLAKNDDAYIIFTEEFLLKTLIHDNAVTRHRLKQLKEKKLELGIE